MAEPSLPKPVHGIQNLGPLHGVRILLTSAAVPGAGRATTPASMAMRETSAALSRARGDDTLRDATTEPETYASATIAARNLGSCAITIWGLTVNIRV